MSNPPEISSILLAVPTVTAFVGRTERGPINEAVPLQSFEQFQRRFGGHVPFSTVSHAAQHYFQHGGRDAVVVRVANRATRAGFALPAGDEFLYLQARQPGSGEFLRISVDHEPDTEKLERFSLVVQRVAGHGSNRVVDQELHTSLSMNPADQDFIAERLRRSTMIRLNVPLPARMPDATLASRAGAPIPYVETVSAGSDGDDLTDYDIVGSNVERTGLYALERVPRVDLICIPPSPGAELGVTTFLAAERYCEQRRALLIWDPPWSWHSARSAIDALRGGSLISRNALTYFPRLRPRHPVIEFPQGLPACGAIAAAIAAQAACGVWSTPAGRGAGIKASLVGFDELDDAERAALRRHGVNLLCCVDGHSYVLDGDATLAGDASDVWRSLSRRRSLFFIVDSILSATRWVSRNVFEAATVRDLDAQVRPFLSSLHEQGALAGITPAQAFDLTVERTGGNAPAAIRLRIGIALHRPGEFLRYQFDYGPDSCAVRRAPAQEAQQLAI